jgi:hypothetical protein
VDKQQIEYHNIVPIIYTVYQISRGCDMKLLRKLLRKFPTIDHLCRKFNLFGKQEVNERKPEFKSQGMVPLVYALYEIYRGFNKTLLRKLLRKFPTIHD